MTCWEILAIEQTEDIQQIKQAYAKKLKTIDIKNDVAKFQELKEAFDLAKKIAQLKHEEQEASIDEEIPTFSSNVFSKPEALVDEERHLAFETVFEMKEFENSLEAFLEEEAFYDEVANWQGFLHDYLFVDLESFSEIQTCLQNFLINYYQIISKKVRKYIFELCQMADSQGQHDFILAYADFNFSFYQEIALSKRRDYFKTRNQLFLLLFRPESDIRLSELLQHCKDIYQQDNDLALLEAYLMLWQDFRLKDSKTRNYIESHTYQQGEDEIPWNFIHIYSEFVLAKKRGREKSVNLDSFFKTKSNKIPTAIYGLLEGNCAYLTNQSKATYYYWNELQATYPDKFKKREFVIGKNLKHRWYSNSWYFLLIGVIIVRLLFKIGQLTEQSTSVPDIDTNPIPYSELLSEIANSETGNLWETNESTTSTTDSAPTFEKDLKMFSPNPNEDEPVSYESYEQGGFAAVVPDYEHYNQADAETILGSPSKVIEEPAEIAHLLEEQEVETIKAELNKGNLTLEQAKAFMMQAFDSKAVVNRVLIYEEEKPNIYLAEDQVIYITPMTKYINFNGKIQ